MAWIESHQKLKEHPKVSDLMNQMGWDLDTTIGKLHRFWWWCVDYAENGDLTRHNDSRIAGAMGVAMADSKKLIEAMVKSCWIDQKPYFRVHDWWDYSGRFLQSRYSKSPSKWKAIRKAYGIRTDSDVTYIPTNIHNQPTKGQPDYQIPESLKKDAEPITRWLNYLAERGRAIEGPISLDAFFKKMLELGPGRAAAIEYSIANGWFSIHESKDAAKKDEKPPSYWTKELKA